MDWFNPPNSMVWNVKCVGEGLHPANIQNTDYKVFKILMESKNKLKFRILVMLRNSQNKCSQKQKVR